MAQRTGSTGGLPADPASSTIFSYPRRTARNGAAARDGGRTGTACDLSAIFKPPWPARAGQGSFNGERSLTGRGVWKMGRPARDAHLSRIFFQAERPRPRKGRVGHALDTGQRDMGSVAQLPLARAALRRGTWNAHPSIVRTLGIGAVRTRVRCRQRLLRPPPGGRAALEVIHNEM